MLGPWQPGITCPDGCWTPIAENDFVIGSFDWTGFDYKGEPSPYVWPDINSVMFLYLFHSWFNGYFLYSILE